MLSMTLFIHVYGECGYVRANMHNAELGPIFPSTLLGDMELGSTLPSTLLGEMELGSTFPSTLLGWMELAIYMYMYGEN